MIFNHVKIPLTHASSQAAFLADRKSHKSRAGEIKIGWFPISLPGRYRVGEYMLGERTVS